MKKNKNIFFAALAILSLIAFASTAYAVYSLFHYLAIPNEDEQINITEIITTSISLSNINGGQKALACTIEDAASDYVNTHEAEGIVFASHDSAFSKEYLRKVADELFRNSYGDEINYLSVVEVILYADTEISAECNSTYESVQLFISANGVLPQNSILNRKYENSIITLYLPDENADYRDYAYVLSREYGRHFAKYNFNLSFTEEDVNSDYYKMRALGFEDRIILDESNEIDENLKKWTLSEIAAYDYVYLLGSETVHNIELFKDTLGKHFECELDLDRGQKPKVLPYIKKCFNGMPHINPSIEMPLEIDGLVDYFDRFVEVERNFIAEIVELDTMGLEAKKASDNQQYITWEQPFDDSDVLYTLIAYDEHDNIVAMVKTTKINDIASASFGVYEKYTICYFNYSTVDQNQFYYELGDIIRFRVSVTFPDGTVLLSDYIEQVY